MSGRANIRIGTVSARRRNVDRSMRALMLFALLLALTPLFWILIDVIKMGIHAIHGLSFFTQGPNGDQSSTRGGIADGIIGTLIMVGLAAAMSIPLGVMGAIFLSEFSPRSRFAGLVRFFADVMTGIPSIIVGLFIYLAVVLTFGGYSAFAGSLALAVIMWPVVLRSSEEMLLLVGRDVREAALALGIPRWRTISLVVLPTALPGMVTGIMLAVGRAAGETAPLLFTAFGNLFTTTNPVQPMSSLSLIIYRGAQSPFPASIARAWAAALTLIVIVLIFSLGGRALAQRRAAGAAA